MSKIAGNVQHAQCGHLAQHHDEPKHAVSFVNEQSCNHWDPHGITLYFITKAAISETHHAKSHSRARISQQDVAAGGVVGRWFNTIDGKNKLS